MIESLPALNRLFSCLYCNEECKDLNSLSSVSTHFYNGVHEFMMKEGNRPGIKSVVFERGMIGLEVDIFLFLNNVAFHGLANLDMSRIKKSAREPRLRVMLTGAEDPIIEQLAAFLCSSIKNVVIAEFISFFTFSDLTLCVKLLGSSTIRNLRFTFEILDDTKIPFIFSTMPKATECLSIRMFSQLQINDPAAFVRALYTNSITRIRLANHSFLQPPFPDFFGLPHTYWELFINEKLSNGSFEW
ncbi:hypothetical protein PMAYCL1PPCAC_10994, partial [Pristionchus mayeri]